MSPRLKNMIKETGTVMVAGKHIAAAKLNSGFVVYLTNINKVRVAHSSLAKTFVPSVGDYHGA